MTHRRAEIPTPCPVARAARRIVRALAAGALAASITACDSPRASKPPVAAAEEGRLAAVGLERGDDANARARPAIVLRPVDGGAPTAMFHGATADEAYGTATVAADVRRLEIRVSGAAQK